MANEVKELILQGHAVIKMENETMQSLSAARPRPNVKEILKAALDELEALPEFAKANYYVIPYKEKKNDPNSKIVNVEGLSIKAAMVLQRHYRNAMAGAQITGEDERSFQIQGAALDIENNIRIQRPRSVLKVEYDRATKTEIRLSDQKMEQKLQSEISKAIRNAVLAIIPEPIKIAYWRRAKELAASGQSSEAKGKKIEPLEARIAKMLVAFVKLGASEPQILRFLEKPTLDKVTEEDLGTLIGVYNAIQDKETSVEEAFGSAETIATAASAPAQGAQDLSSVLRNGGEAPGAEAKPSDRPNTDGEDLFGRAPLFPDERAEKTPRDQALEGIAADLRQIWKLFPDAITPADEEYLKKIFTRAWKVGSWEAVQKLALDRIQAGSAQFAKDLAFVLQNVKPHAREGGSR